MPPNTTSIRQAAVSGMFYDADSDGLRQHIAGLLARARTDRPATPRVLIVPHAGYVYSGQTAAEAYRYLLPMRERIKRVVLFGPAHRVYLKTMAVPSVDAFSTPLGEVPLDRVAIDHLAMLPGVCVSDEAHREEHSLEVQLPFLQSVLSSFSLVPVVVGHCDAHQVAAAMDALLSGPETLLVVSTDLSHFHSYEEAKQLDSLTCDRLLAKENALHSEEACGANALNGLMSSRLCGSLEIELVGACNSGDTAGDKNRVVGYGAFILH